eukprot:13627720-Alexandrium_andersonii.AAC.1
MKSDRKQYEVSMRKATCRAAPIHKQRIDELLGMVKLSSQSCVEDSVGEAKSPEAFASPRAQGSEQFGGELVVHQVVWPDISGMLSSSDDEPQPAKKAEAVHVRVSPPCADVEVSVSSLTDPDLRDALNAEPLDASHH